MDYYIGVVGINPDTFWNNTWVDNHRLSEAHQLNQLDTWQTARYVAFSIYKTTFGYSGKPVFKSLDSPADLFSLPNDPKPTVLSEQDGENLLKSMAKKK